MFIDFLVQHWWYFAVGAAMYVVVSVIVGFADMLSEVASVLMYVICWPIMVLVGLAVVGRKLVVSIVYG